MAGIIVHLALLVAAVSASPVARQTQNCTGTAYIIAARGSIVDASQCNTTDHLGILSDITNAVTQRANVKVTVAPLNYPASTGNPCQPSYLQSRTTGEQGMTTLIQNRVNTCGNTSNIVLVGYSQGAQVITDLISGNSSTGVAALGATYVKQLKAVVLIANPAQMPGAPYNNNNTAPNGAQPAPNGPSKPTQPSFIIPNPQNVNALGQRIVAYCQKGDYFCDAPNTSGTTIHQMEVQTWEQPAISFILNRI